jgi:hypothetical protein
VGPLEEPAGTGQLTFFSGNFFGPAYFFRNVSLAPPAFSQASFSWAILVGKKLRSPRKKF